MSYESYDGLPDFEMQVHLLLDGSGTMGEKERKTGEPKHVRVAWLAQQLLNRLDDPQYSEAQVTLAVFSGDRRGEVKILTLLEDYCPHECKTYTGNTDLAYWDPLTPENRKQGMGNLTPIGSVLAWASHRAEDWITAAPGA